MGAITALSHDVVIPAPGLGVDGFAHGAQQAQRLPGGAEDGLEALAHQGADGRGRGVEDADLVLVDDVPEA
ncbi:hypothetical protein G6F64_014947 [Rhizopus arrhizus]|uniref:Uncharacterized protein n=1 Tax=Rhizopus oryzae TaxID=64495 RepID=A0A9P6WSG6_RHIOR|nr:hypothetical protein G6F64_014947 [Rhizopus arrhizus]